MRNLRGKQILLIGLMVLVIVAGYYRWTQNNAGDAVTVNSDVLPADAGAAQASETPSDSGYFTTARRERNSARDKSIELWNDVIRKDESTANAKSEAEKNISDTAKYIESENTIENLVRAKGYEDCIAFVDENGVNTVVKADGLKASDVTQIKDIIVNQTGVSVSKIKISSKK